MRKKIISITEATGWYYYQVNDDTCRDKYIFQRLAVWATYESGETLGLLSIPLEGTLELSRPPENKGGYVHWDALNSDLQKEALAQNKLAGTAPAEIKK